MPANNVEAIRASIRQELNAADEVFQVVGRPGSNVYNFSNANRTNSGYFDPEAVIEMFAETLDESLRRSNRSISRLSSGG